MKKLIVLISVLSVLGLSAAPSVAGDREWATAGKVLAGVVGASMIAGAASHGYHDRYYYERPVHYARPVYYERPVYSRTHYYERPYYGHYCGVHHQYGCCNAPVYYNEYYY